jgi:hypothetical protein
MHDDEFWFKRWFVWGYWPIRWQGWAAIAVFMIYALTAVVSLQWLAREGLLNREWIFWSFATLHFMVFLGFFGFVHLRTRLE